MTNNVRFTFSGSDTTRVVYNYYWARQIELVILQMNFAELILRNNHNTLERIFCVSYTTLIRMHALKVNNSLKVSNIKCRFKHSISTMVICGSYMSEFSVSKNMKKNVVDFGKWEINKEDSGRPSLKSQSILHIKGGSRKGSFTFMSSINCQRIEK